MAEIQDLDSEVGELETVETQIQQTEKQEVPDLPPKYRGKSVEDLMKMHQEAERLIDRQSREVGEVRKLADELIKSQLTPKPEAEKPKEVDFFENPQESVRQLVESNPKVLAAENYARQVQMAQSRARLLQKHPDAQQIATQDTEFQEWVSKSRVRMQLFQQAENYDFNAADELMSTYKELKQYRQQKVVEVDTKARDQTLRAASVDSGGTGESSKKMYRRADLIRLNMRDPEKYAAMSDEIMLAYSEGRVK